MVERFDPQAWAWKPAEAATCDFASSDDADPPALDWRVFGRIVRVEAQRRADEAAQSSSAEGGE